MSIDSTNTSNQINKKVHGKKPPLPYNLSNGESKPIRNNQTVINKLNLNELINPSQSVVNRGLEIPFASATYRASPSRPPTSSSMPFGTISSSSSTPPNTHCRKHSESFRLKDSFKRDKYSPNPTQTEVEPGSRNSQSLNAKKKKASPNFASSFYFLQFKIQSFVSLLGIF